MAEITLKRTTLMPGNIKKYQPNDPVCVTVDFPYPRPIGAMWYVLQVTNKIVSELKYLEEIWETPQEITRKIPYHWWNNWRENIPQLSRIIGEQILSVPQFIEFKDEFLKVAVTYGSVLDQFVIGAPTGSFVSTPIGLKVSGDGKLLEIEGTARFAIIKYLTPQIYQKRRYNINILRLKTSVRDLLASQGIVQITGDELTQCVVDRING